MLLYDFIDWLQGYKKTEDKPQNEVNLQTKPITREVEVDLPYLPCSGVNIRQYE